MNKVLTIVMLFLPLISFAQNSSQMSFYYEVNIIRASHGLSPLEATRELEELAYLYSSICAQEGMISHTYLSDSEVLQVAQKMGVPYYRSIGEILQAGPVYKMKNKEYVVRRFLESPDHRAVILDKDAVEIGVGSVRKGDNIYLTSYVGRY